MWLLGSQGRLHSMDGIISYMYEYREAEHAGLGHFVSFRQTFNTSSPKLFIRL